MYQRGYSSFWAAMSSQIGSFWTKRPKGECGNGHMPNNHLAYHTSPLSQPKALFVPKVKQLLRALPVTNHRLYLGNVFSQPSELGYFPRNLTPVNMIFSRVSTINNFCLCLPCFPTNPLGGINLGRNLGTPERQPRCWCCCSSQALVSPLSKGFLPGPVICVGAGGLASKLLT